MRIELWLERFAKPGLEPGDRVIVSNLQKLQPGMPVQIANAPTGQKPAAKAD